MDYEKESQILKGLAHPMRLRIVEMLLDDECCVTDVTNLLGLPQSTVSQHIGVLKNCGILYPVKYGTKTCYKVTNQKVAGLVSVLLNEN